MPVIINGTTGIDSPAAALTTPLPVASGGTGASSLSGITTGTATNLAGGSNGTIPYQSAAGTTQMLAVGTSGQVLQTNGAGAPTWVTPSSGALVYISQVVASSASTVDIENAFTAYEQYVIIGSAITTTSDFNIRVKIGGSYITSATYNYWGVGGYSTQSVVTIQGGTSTTEIFAYGNTFATVANFYLTIGVKSGKRSVIKYEITGDTSNDAASMTGSGVNESTGALQGIRIFGSTYTGTFRLYGIANS
jgi:hypothetical protein